MSAEVDYQSNRASWAEIAAHLSSCDHDFVPPLSGRVDIRDYARKIAREAMRFEAWSGGTLIGLVAVYCNDQERRCAYVTSVSVLKAWAGKGIVARLLSRSVSHAKSSGMRQISLDVASDNMPAFRLYQKIGFVAGTVTKTGINMNLSLFGEEDHEDQA